jgi:hypothetical protein
LDALAAAIAQKKAEIVSRSMHPEAAFTLRSALEDTVAVVVPTQESSGAVDGTITPRKNNKKEEAENKKKKKVVSQLGPFPAMRRLPATVASRRSPRSFSNAKGKPVPSSSFEGTQQAQVDGRSKTRSKNKAAKKAATTPPRRSGRNDAMKGQQAEVLKVARLAHSNRQTHAGDLQAKLLELIELGVAV